MREKSNKRNHEKTVPEIYGEKMKAIIYGRIKKAVHAIREMDDAGVDVFLNEMEKQTENIRGKDFEVFSNFTLGMLENANKAKKKPRKREQSVKPDKPSQEEHKKEICAIIGYVSKDKDVIGKTHDVIEQIKTLADEGVPGTSYEVSNLRESCRVKEVYYQKDDVNISISMRREKQRG